MRGRGAAVIVIFVVVCARACRQSLRTTQLDNSASPGRVLLSERYGGVRARKEAEHGV